MYHVCSSAKVPFKNKDSLYNYSRSYIMYKVDYDSITNLLIYHTSLFWSL